LDHRDNVPGGPAFRLEASISSLSVRLIDDTERRREAMKYMLLILAELE
jgi:hypothetical protein